MYLHRARMSLKIVPRPLTSSSGQPGVRTLGVLRPSLLRPSLLEPVIEELDVKGHQEVRLEAQQEARPGAAAVERLCGRGSGAAEALGRRPWREWLAEPHCQEWQGSRDFLSIRGSSASCSNIANNPTTAQCTATVQPWAHLVLLVLKERRQRVAQRALLRRALVQPPLKRRAAGAKQVE